MYTNNLKKSGDVIKLLDEVSVEVKGLATVISVDCSDKDGKKLCKKLKVPTDKNYVIKHYKDGEYHKDYDRALKSKSMVTFLKDPSGDLPWEEDPAAQDVAHLHSPKQLSSLLRRRRPTGRATDQGSVTRVRALTFRSSLPTRGLSARPMKKSYRTLPVWPPSASISPLRKETAYEYTDSADESTMEAVMSSR